jgi:hypothetical protein
MPLAMCISWEEEEEAVTMRATTASSRSSMTSGSMSHVTRMNASCHACAWGVSHVSTSVMAHVRMRLVTCVRETRHTCEWGMVHVRGSCVAATRCNTLQHATNNNALRHTATHCNTLQHTATHCNFSHGAHMREPFRIFGWVMSHV